MSPQCIDPRFLTLPLPTPFAAPPLSSVAPTPPVSLQVRKNVSTSSSTTAVSTASSGSTARAEGVDDDEKAVKIQHRVQDDVQGLEWTGMKRTGQGLRTIRPRPMSAPAPAAPVHGEGMRGGGNGMAHKAPTTGRSHAHAHPRSVRDAPYFALPVPNTAPQPRSKEAVSLFMLQTQFVHGLEARYAEAELERTAKRAQKRRADEERVAEFEHEHERELERERERRYRAVTIGAVRDVRIVDGMQEASSAMSTSSTPPPPQNQNQPTQAQLSWDEVCDIAQNMSDRPPGFDFDFALTDEEIACLDRQLRAPTRTVIQNQLQVQTAPIPIPAVIGVNANPAIPATLFAKPLIPLPVARANPKIKRHPEQYELDEARKHAEAARKEELLRAEQTRKEQLLLAETERQVHLLLAERERKEARLRAEQARREQLIREAHEEAARRRAAEVARKRAVVEMYKAGKRGMVGERPSSCSYSGTTSTSGLATNSGSVTESRLATRTASRTVAKPASASTRISIEERAEMLKKAAAQIRAQERAMIAAGMSRQAVPTPVQTPAQAKAKTPQAEVANPPQQSHVPTQAPIPSPTNHTASNAMPVAAPVDSYPIPTSGFLDGFATPEGYELAQYLNAYMGNNVFPEPDIDFERHIRARDPSGGLGSGSTAVQRTSTAQARRSTSVGRVVESGREYFVL